MKRFGNLFESIFSMDNLYDAYIDARKGKRGKASCFNFEKNIGANLKSIHDSLMRNTYQPRPYFKFIVREPKERLIYAPSFGDVVVQHAIYRIVYHIFNRTFIDTSFACRRGYGTHAASRYTVRSLQACSADQYTLKLDVRKFFYSIDRTILKNLIQKKIKDDRLVGVMMQFADMDTNTGIPIGNLLSQLYALIYLNPLDHYLKRCMRVRNYCRYVDDFILFGLSHDQCKHYLVKIVDFLKNSLHLELSKWTIQKVKRGVNFVGYRTWSSRRFIRKYSLYKFKRAVKRGRQDVVVSLLGHAKDTNSLNYMINIIKECDNANIFIPEKRWITCRA